jgi:hypothetical protein
MAQPTPSIDWASVAEDLRAFEAEILVDERPRCSDLLAPISYDPELPFDANWDIRASRLVYNRIGE